MDKRFLAPIVIFAAIISGFFISNLSQSTLQKEQEEIPLTANQVLSNYSDTLKTGGKFEDMNSWDWIGENNEHLPLTGKMLVIGIRGNGTMGQYGAIQNNNVEEVTSGFLHELAVDSDMFFKSEGFIKNAENTREYTEVSINSKRIGYESDNIKCLVTLQEKSDPFGYIVCGEIDQNQLSQQKEFSNLIDAKKAKDPDYTFRVVKVEGEYAQGFITDATTLGWFAKKINGKWQIVSTTPDIPLCSDMSEHSIPKSLWENCI